MKNTVPVMIMLCIFWIFKNTKYLFQYKDFGVIHSFVYRTKNTAPVHYCGSVIQEHCTFADIHESVKVQNGMLLE